MKEKNSLEAQLRSWTLRRPSPRLERQLFRFQPHRFALPKLASVFVPVAACLVLTLAGVNRFEPELLNSKERRAALVGLSLSNQSFAAFLPGNSQSSANRWDTFEWTNGGYSQSSVRSFKHSEALNLE